MIKDKIKKLLEQKPPNGKEALMDLAEQLDKFEQEIIELKKRIRK